MKNSKNDHKARLTGDAPAHETRQDDVVLAVIHALNLFIAQATSDSIGPVARILYRAKEDLVYWAVEQGFQETPEEKFVNKYLYGNDLFAASDYLRRLYSTNGISNAWINYGIGKQVFTLVESLRQPAKISEDQI